MRRLILSLICLILPAAGLAADATADLYSARAVVTGKGEKNRQLGFQDCLDKVLVRVSGDQRLLAKPELPGLKAHAGDFVASFAYRDRLNGVPIHDEQGSYDRPHDLTCIFDRGKIDAVLAGLGGRPWLAERPTMVPLLAVERGAKRFVLAADGAGDPAMPESFAAAAAPLAMKIALPDTAEIATAGLGDGNLWKAGRGQLEAIAKASGGAVPLLGRLKWSDADLGWVADWRIRFEGRTYDWQVRGVSFDEAFRVAMRGGAQVLSGNGQP
jgi:hypothetical protein